MSTYPKLALSMSKNICDSTVDTMDMIGRLDKISELLSTTLNKKLKKLDLSNKAALLERTSSLWKPNRWSTDDGDLLLSSSQGDECCSDVEFIKRRKFLSELEEISHLRKVVEIIAAKKVDLAIKNYDFIDMNIKTIDAEMTMLESAIKTTGNTVPVEQTMESKVHSSICTLKRKQREISDVDDNSLDIETNEPVYCICKRIAFGDMIACDNEDCPVEWFHYPCVNLTRKPKNSWVCSLCSNKKKK